MSEKEIGLRLRAERKRLNLTQAQLGDIGGVSLSSQNAYESGTHFPDIRYLAKVASAGVNIKYVALGSGSKFAVLSDDELMAISEISRVVQTWAPKSGKSLSLTDRLHLIRSFYEQYQATSEVNLESYEQTLKLVG